MIDIESNNNNFVNITHNEQDNNYIVKADFFQIPFFKTMFYDANQYIKYIKAAEKLIRTSDYYKDYINYIKGEIGLNYCMVLPNINDEATDVEMHHGPMLTLFDYCDIVATHMIKNNENLTTFKLASVVIDEHFKNNVQVVMLSKTVHQLVHTGKIFIHPKQAFGDINKFLTKYSDGITAEIADNINTYIEMAETTFTDSYDGNLLQAKPITSWKNNKFSLSDLKSKIGRTVKSDLEDELFN